MSTREGWRSAARPGPGGLIIIGPWLNALWIRAREAGHSETVNHHPDRAERVVEAVAHACYIHAILDAAMRRRSPRLVAAANLSSLVLPQLPDELVVHVGFYLEDACHLLFMELVCKAWHSALTATAVDEVLWKALTLNKFARVAAILSASPVPPAAFRDVYRCQLRAKAVCPAPEDEYEPAPEPACRLCDFVFTYELRYGQQLIAEQSAVGRWIHKRSEISMPLIDGWEDKSAWFMDLTTDVGSLTLTVFVTWKMRTICLLNSQEMTGALQGDPEACFHNDKRLPLISNRTRRLILPDATGGPDIWAFFDTSTSRCLINFNVPLGPNDFDDLDLQDTLRYLELGVPWDWPLARV